MKLFGIIGLTALAVTILACGEESDSESTGESDTPNKEKQVQEKKVLEPHFHIEKQTQLVLDTNLRWSYRGMHVLSPQVVWLSGTNGTVALSKDGGETWDINTVSNCETCDFRDISALNDSTAIAVSIASPGYIYKTTNSGKDWKLVYSNDDSSVFMDAIEFWDENNGLVFGDPVDDLVFLLKTTDGGETWERVNHIAVPKALGTAGFAASGTSIALGENGLAWIGLGGKHSFVLKSKDYGVQWQVLETPMPQGSEGRGIYSLTFMNENIGVAVGGNWEKELSDSCAAYTSDGGESWQLISAGSPNGYRSCVAVGGESCEALDPFFVTCGSSGIDLSVNNGQSWARVDSTNLNVIEFAPGTGIGWGADSWGNVYRLEVKFE